VARPANAKKTRNRPVADSGSSGISPEPQPPAKKRRGQRAWEIELSIEQGLESLSRHPIGGLAPEARATAHTEVIGGILAAISLRKAASQPRHRTKGSDRRVEQPVSLLQKNPVA
jgi:hypothetical protein